MPIRNEVVPAAGPPAGRDPSSRVLLADEIRGITTSHVAIPSGQAWEAAGLPRGVRVLFFFGGAGSVEVGDRTFILDEMAALCVPSVAGVTARSSSEPVELLEILIDQAARGVAASAPPVAAPAQLVPYSRCPTYWEAIKSDRTVSRTIVPDGAVPRFCMGSVQVEGPDVVGAHRHPMLEQLFFGLPGNRCTVSADEDRLDFGERTLVHIPRGSSHGATVEQGAVLHYVWMDFFEGDDMSYIAESHRPRSGGEGS